MALIQFKRRFSMAHRLRHERTSKCATPHGHNEFVSVTLALRNGSERAIGWGASNYAESFAKLKRHWHRFVDDSLDHAFQLGADDPLIGYFQTHEPDILPRLLILRGDPTTEAVATALYQKLNAIMAAHLPDFECVRFELEETPTNSVILTPAELALAPADLGAWCHRADMSLNDIVAAQSWPPLESPQ